MDTNVNPNANYFQPGQGGNPNGSNDAPGTNSYAPGGSQYDQREMVDWSKDSQGNPLSTAVPSAPTALNSSNIAPTAPTALPPYNPSYTGPSSNTSIPTPAQIVGDANQPTQADAQQQTILNKIAELTGSNKGQTSLTNAAETSAGVPALQKTYNDLNAQLEGLNNQATDLQNQASKGGAIENTAENGAIGVTGMTGVNANITKALRDNQIKQSAIASQSLTVKSALFGAQGNLSMAKDAADKAATAQYEDQQNQLDYQKALLAALGPTLSKQDKAQATIQAQALQDRQTQITNAQDDKKTIIAMAAAAMKLYPNDSAVQYAAQQALSESNQQVPNLQKALALVGQYQTDPQATAKAVAELALTRAQIANTTATTQKTYADINKIKADTLVASAGNVDVPTTVANLQSKPNMASDQLFGLTPNGLIQKAQEALVSNGNIQGMGLGATGKVGAQRQLITNYAGYLADKAGMTIPQITQAYKANSKAVLDVTNRIAKIDTTSGTLVGQFPRIAQLAGSVGNLGITESDLTKTKTQVASKFGSTDAANFIELIQTVRADYSAMQAAIGGSRGGTFFAQNAQEAIPLGLTPDQYLGLADTIKQSADIASQSSATEIQKLAGATPTGLGPTAPNTVLPPTQIPSGYFQASDGLLYKK